jgi:rubrerythrin
MSVQLNADEIYQMAEQIERNGARFYRKAAGSAGSADVRDLLERLAVMEDEHERTFAAMRAGLPDEARVPMVFDPENESAQYLEAMADGYVFDVREDPSAALTGAESVADILRMAIGREKESVVFYEAMKAMVPPNAGYAGLDRIIKEELGHIGALSKALAARR